MSQKLHFKWLAAGVALSALWMSGCVVQDAGEEGVESANAAPAPNASELAAGEVTVSIAAEKGKIGSLEAVTVTITLTNTASKPVRLLSWYAPGEELEEDLFLVHVSGQAVEFTGPHYKRAAPEDTDYVTIAPGKSISRTVDLTGFYDFSQTGDYTIRYSGAYLPQGAAQPVALESHSRDEPF